MKKLHLPLLTDPLFYAAAAWLLAVGILRYCGAPTWLCMTAATLIALAAGGIVFCLLSAKTQKVRLGARERAEKDALMLHLALEKEERVRLMMLEALNADGREAHCDKDAILSDGVPFVPLYTMEPVSADAVAKLLRAYDGAPFCLACNALSPAAERLLTSFGATVMDGDATYALCKRGGVFPEKYICGNAPRRTPRTRLQAAFARRNARPFFVSGALLLLMSLFALYPVYYLVTGSVLTITSLIVRVAGRA